MLASLAESKESCSQTRSDTGLICSLFQAGLLRIFSTISVLTVLVVIVVLGNSLVIAAVLLRRRLRSATGLLILSLGVADLLVRRVHCSLKLVW